MKISTRNKSIITLIGGSAMGRIFTFITIPIITRIYTPAEYGDLAIISSLILMIGPLLGLRYNVAIPLLKSDKQAFIFLKTCFFISIIIASIISIIFFIMVNNIAFLKSNKYIEVINNNFLFCFIGCLLYSFNESIIFFNTKLKKFTIMSSSQIIQALSDFSLKFILGKLSFSSYGLIAGHSLQLAPSIIFCVFHIRKISFLKTKVVKIKTILLIIFKFRDFLFYRLPSQFFLSYSMQVPLVFFGAFYTKEDTGQLSLALMTLSVPVTLIANNIGYVFYSEISQIRSNSFLKKVTYNTIKKSMLLAIIPTGILFFGGNILYRFVFGDEWALAGDFAEILSINLFFQFITLPLINIFTVMRENKFFLYINIIRSFVTTTPFFIAYIYGLNSKTVIYIYVIFAIAYYIYFLYNVYRQINKGIFND